MMTLAVLLAAGLMAFAAFTAFGLPFMVMGPRALEEFSERKDQQAMLATLAAAASLIAALPFAAPALISEAPVVQVMAQTHTGPALDALA